MLWRGEGLEGPAPPEPWPARVESFKLACALHAGQRERDLHDVLQLVAPMLAKFMAGGNK